LRIQAVLIDVGGVLVDEGEFYRLMQTQLLELLREEGFMVSEEEMDELLAQAIRRGFSTYRHAVLWYFTKPDVTKFRRLQGRLRSLREFYRFWRPEPVPGALEVVRALSRNYKLALAGNQPSEIRKILQEQGLIEHFHFDLVSEDLGLGKPELLFFQIVLDSLGVRPEEAVMVGDRLDNDVYPAKRLGMRTIRLLSWPFSLQEVRTPAEEPDLTVKELKELPRAIEELAKG